MNVPRSAYRHAFVVGAYVGAIGFVLRVMGPFIGIPLRIGAAIGTLYYVALAVALGAKLGWSYAAWNALPAGCRLTGLGRHVPPDEAVWRHFMPWSTLFWQFTVHVGVAEATNSVLASYDTHAETSTRLPFIACATLLLPGINLVLFPAFLYAHMESVDRAQEEMTRCLAAAPVARPYVPPHRPSHLSLVWPIVLASLCLWLGVPIVLANLVHAMVKRSDDSPTRTTSVATPDRIEFHANRIAEAMATCARLNERKLPGELAACREADLPVQVAHIEGGADYEWHDDTLTTVAWSRKSTHAPRRVVCDSVTCSVRTERIVPDAAAFVVPANETPANVTNDLEAFADGLVACATARHAVPDNLSDCPDVKKQLDAANAARGGVIYVYATPKLTAWTPTYGRTFGERRIACDQAHCWKQ